MHQMCYYHLIMRYPKLLKLINKCHIGNHTDYLYDFLIGIEMEEGPNV